MCVYLWYDLLCFNEYSHIAPQAVADLTLTTTSTSINLEWVPPSDRNGTFDYTITFNARSSFNYPNHPDRIQEDSYSKITLFGTNTSYTLVNVLAFADYEVTITAFNRLHGIEFSGPTVNESIRSLPQSESEVFACEMLELLAVHMVLSFIFMRLLYIAVLLIRWDFLI